MKIAIILPSLANKGPIIVAHDMVIGIVLLGHQCQVFYFDDLIELSFPCPTKRIKFSDTIDFKEFDIVHSHMLRPDIWVALHKPLFGNSCKFVSTIHQNIDANLRSDYSRIKAAIGIKLWYWSLRRQDEIVVLSHHHLDLYRKRLSKRHISTIYNGRDVDNSQAIASDDKPALKRFRAKYKTLGALANIVEIKGFDQVIKALVSLPEYGMIFVGDGVEQQRLERLASDLGVTEQCLWIGRRASATAYLSYIDVYIMSSHSEGFPLAMIEAAIYSCSIVCSDLPIFRELFNADLVEFYELNNINLLIKAIDTAYQKREERGKLISNFAIQNYSISAMVHNYVQLYTNIKR